MIIEDTYSRHNIREHVLKDISDTLLIPIQKGVDALNLYLGGNYYHSKNKRLEQLIDKPVLQLIMEVLILVLPVEGPQPIQGVAGQLAKYFIYEDLFDGIKTASEILVVLAETDLYDVICADSSDTGSIMIKSNYSLEEKTLQYIENTKYLPPMICIPDEITDNDISGYLTKSESVILGNGNHHHMPQALDVLNICNKMSLSLDPMILMYKELPKKTADTREKVEAHNRLVQASDETYEELLSQGNQFHLTWKYDKRGRIYSQGYHVNIQSTEYKKALINLTKKEIIQ